VPLISLRFVSPPLHNLVVGILEVPVRWLRSGRDKRPDSHLDAIRIFTAALELRGFVAPTGQRITDILLRGQDLAFLPEGADEAPENWVMFAPSDILFVVPPALPKRAALRTKSTLRDVFVEVDPYRVTGTAHLAAEEVLDDEYRQRQPFVALTGAKVEWRGNELKFDVAIVNLGTSTRFGLVSND
jgi:hypothetical protein